MAATIMSLESSFNTALGQSRSFAEALAHKVAREAFEVTCGTAASLAFMAFAAALALPRKR